VCRKKTVDDRKIKLHVTKPKRQEKRGTGQSILGHSTVLLERLREVLSEAGYFYDSSSVPFLFSVDLLPTGNSLEKVQIGIDD
jgi:hypothetical protein